MITKTIPYGHQYVTEEDIKAVTEVLTADYMTQGPIVGEFEKDFCKYLGCKYARMVSNGTAALHICAQAINVKPGDKVITTPNTFVASANGFRYQGAEIIFCDIDPKTFLMDFDKLEQILKASPKGTYKAVVPVDFAGYPIDEERLRNLADEYGFYLIVDACHAPGAKFIDSKGEEQKVGNCKYADLTVFSFHPVKHIAAGEGGAITTNNKELFDRVALFTSHGITKNPDLMTKNEGGWYYEMLELGHNYRITEMQAALAKSQLKRLDWSLQRRNEIAQKYDETFANMQGIITPYRAKDIFHAFHLYMIQVEDRKGLYDFMHEHLVHVQVLYIPAHLMPYYRQFGWKEGDMPMAEKYYAHCLALPMFPSLTDEEQDWVIRQVKEFLKTK